MRVCAECRNPVNDSEVDESGVCDDCRRIDEEAQKIDEVYDRWLDGELTDLP